VKEQPGIHLTIANTIIDLVQGDIKEHFPVAGIPLRGDILGFGTTTSIDNGELTFIYDETDAETVIFKCHANTGGIHKVCPGDGSDHFPYVCFSSDATDMGYPIDLLSLNSTSDWRLADWLIGLRLLSISSTNQLICTALELNVIGTTLLLLWHPNFV